MKIISLLTVLLFCNAMVMSQENFQKDTIRTDKGDLEITFLGHGTLYFTFDSKVIHIDPVDMYADYSLLPKADLIFVTHQHHDHFQAGTIDLLMKEGTELVFTKICADSYQGEGISAANGDMLNLKDIRVEVVPAYNLVHERSNGVPFHPKGEGNGYVFNFGDKQVYIGGDTENIPEMKKLKDIDIAFLPMNLPYTMTPEMVVEAVIMFKPKILYPYHYGNTNIDDLLTLMKDIDYCEVRVREMR
ncbi:MAG: MBL fold metallo-hydrolase [Bacteroidales bacterium]|nr:MBL fold metallo-hydrolase [Bacteroidales bacterium]